MITVVGGTYNEMCFEPFFQETYGSGLRACKVLLSLNNEEKIHFHTFLGDERLSYLESFKEVFRGFTYNAVKIEKTLTFYYDYPLSYPHIIPRLDMIKRVENSLEVNSHNVLVYGFIEGSFKVFGDRVVYDPQSPINPKTFTSTGSVAKELTVILNMSEAKALSKTSELEKIKDFFFSEEKVDVLVLKMGAQGANISNKNGEAQNIPVYKTNYVWNIGSGDVFTAVYSHYWFSGLNEFESAKRASYAAAEYCNTKDYQFTELQTNKSLVPLILKESIGQVYLAGPFFTFSQRWLIDRIRKDLIEMGLKVFSPFHDIGFGIPSEVSESDIRELKKSSLIFAVLDGLDSGTLFEIGYAVANNIPIVGFVQNETEDSLLMLYSADYELVNDLTTAIYKAFWKIAEYE